MPVLPCCKLSEGTQINGAGACDGVADLQALETSGHDMWGCISMRSKMWGVPGPLGSVQRKRQQRFQLPALLPAGTWPHVLRVRCNAAALMRPQPAYLEACTSLPSAPSYKCNIALKSKAKSKHT